MLVLGRDCTQNKRNLKTKPNNGGAPYMLPNNSKRGIVLDSASDEPDGRECCCELTPDVLSVAHVLRRSFL